jgi:hypothetical protein
MYIIGYIFFPVLGPGGRARAPWPASNDGVIILKTKLYIDEFNKNGAPGRPLACPRVPQWDCRTAGCCSAGVAVGAAGCYSAGVAVGAAGRLQRRRDGGSGRSLQCRSDGGVVGATGE